MSKILRVNPTKFQYNFHTSESHENWYNEVYSHAEHESGLIFLITIISKDLLSCRCTLFVENV